MFDLLLSYLNNSDWNAVSQWYLNHLDAGHLMLVWEQGKAFSHDDWMSIMLLMANLLILLFLVHLLIKSCRETAFYASRRLVDNQHLFIIKS